MMPEFGAQILATYSQTVTTDVFIREDMKHKPSRRTYYNVHQDPASHLPLSCVEMMLGQRWHS